MVDLLKQAISRNIIFLFLLLSGLWIHAYLVIYYRNYIGKEDCSFNPDDIFMAIAILEVIANCFLSFAFIIAGHLLLFYDDTSQRIKEDKIANFNFFIFFAFTIFFICSILSNITFFRSKYVHGELNTCSNMDAEIAFRLITFSFAWILFIFYFLIILGIVVGFLTTIFIAIKESNLFDCKKISDFFSSCKRINPINEKEISPNCKDTQTECEVSVPITALKNEIKPFTCMICMNNMINIIVEPCNHICMCTACHTQLSKKVCPCCTKGITNVRNIYIQNLNYNL